MNYDFYLSPIGVLYIEASDIGLTEIKLIDAHDIHTARPSIIVLQAISELREYFDGERKNYTVPLDLSSGSIFQQAVWKHLLEIPYGSVITYLDIANALNNPLSVRAVGMANGKNPIPIIVPCHRVIGSNRSLVGYALGLDVKKFLLRHENPKEFGEQVELF
jgi:methylated-DNA-[protein]-cysteine S-methyltransferase